jgi:excisionase family DNA binding protein
MASSRSAGATPATSSLLPSASSSARRTGLLSAAKQAPRELPGPSPLLTADETAALLRTSRKAIYAMAERGCLPGVVRIGRRLLVRREVLLESLSERRAASPGGSRR